MVFRIHTLCFALVLVAEGARADTITVDGVTHSDVFVRPGGAMYYVHVPADGSLFTVPRKSVKPEDLKLTLDKTERRALLQSWQSKLPSAPPGPEKVDQLDKLRDWNESRLKTGLSKGDGPAQVTNRPEILASRRSGRKKFIDGDGIDTLTNRPAKFQNNPEYVEVILQFDPIEIPEKFRVRKHTRTLAAAEAVTGSYDEVVRYYAERNNLDPDLIYAIIKTESNGDPYAVSRAGARGLMQLMPGTAVEMGVQDIFDPAQNIAGGTQYLAKMISYFDGNLTFALAGYNAGPGAVKKYNGIPPFQETRDYVRKVQSLQREYRRSGPPSFIADGAVTQRPNSLAFLPPEEREHYVMVLSNGSTLRAEGIAENGDYYDYVFEGKSLSIRKDWVVSIYEPT